MPSWRCSRPSSASVSRLTTSSAASPWRSSASPSGPYCGFAYDCVATAPTCASAHGTTDPTPRDFDCVATPRCALSRSQATIEYVATTGSVPIRHLHEVEVQQRGVTHEDRRNLWMRKRPLHLVRRGGAHDDGPSLFERLVRGVVPCVE